MERSGDNFSGTVLDDSAPNGIGDGPPNAVAPFTGRFRPEDPLSTFFAAGPPVGGTWRLTVWDQAVPTVGTLLGWSLTF